MIVLFACSVGSAFFHKIVFKKELLLPIVLYLFIVLSLFWTIDFKSSLRGLERQLPLLIIPASFILMPNLNKKVFKTASYVFAIALGVLACFFMINALILYGQDGDSSVFFYHNILLPMELNAIYFSVMVSLSLLYLIFYSKRKIFDWLLSGVLLLFLILLSSKNLIFITVLSIIIGLIIKNKRGFKTLLLGSSLVLITILVTIFSPMKNRLNQELTSNVKEVLTCQEFNRVYPWTGTTIRIFQARIAYELLDEYDVFLMGFGINASKEKIIEKQNHYNLYYGYNEYNFHNQYIQSAVESGLMGLICTLVLLFSIFKGYVNSRELMALFFFLIIASVFTTESYIWRQRGLYHFLILYGLLIKIRPVLSKQRA
jgi:O-antigen ligase